MRAHAEAMKDGGAEGILNTGAIESAIGGPYDGYHEAIHERADALVHRLVLNHGFLDGYKRTSVYLVECLIDQDKR